MAGSYNFAPVSVPGASITWAADMNRAGTIVGFFEDQDGTHGFSFCNGVYSTLDYPGASQTFATGINDAGAIVGTYRDNEGRPNGFVFSNNSFESISYPGTHNATYINGSAINNSGTIVGGYSTQSPPYEDHGFILNGTAFSSFNYGSSEVNLGELH